MRTFVTYEGKRGIWFFSLDADSPWAVEAARLVYRLPYHRASITVARRGDWIDYLSSRNGRVARPLVSLRRSREST